MDNKMKITSAKYRKDSESKHIVSIICTIDGIQSCVPISDGNMEYQEIMKQVKEGTLTIEDAE